MENIFQINMQKVDHYAIIIYTGICFKIPAQPTMHKKASW